MAGLLSEIKKSDLREFKNDFREILRVAYGINKAFKKIQDVSEHVKKMDQVVKLFNNKYPKLNLQLVRSLEQLQVKILIKEKELPKIFEIASRIAGLSGIGLRNFNEVSDTAKLAEVAGKAKKSLYISYFDPERGTDTIALKSFKGSTELIYDYQNIGDENSPQFQLCAYYACIDGIGEEEVYSLLVSMGFTDLPTHQEAHDILEEFKSYWGE